MKPIYRKHREKGSFDYVKPGDNYCYAVLHKNETRDFLPISFFDAATWVTNQFRTDIKLGYKFPRNHDERLNYIEEIIKQKIKEEKSGFQILYLLQQDDLVYLPFDKEDEKAAESNSDNNFWFSKDKKKMEKNL